MASEIDINLNIGTTYRAIMLCMVSQALVNLTGCTASMQIRDSSQPASSPALVTLTTSNGGLVLGGAAGTIALLLTPAETALLTPLVPAVTAFGFTPVPPSTTLSYDIIVTLASGDDIKYVGGNVYASPTVTQLSTIS